MVRSFFCLFLICVLTSCSHHDPAPGNLVPPVIHDQEFSVEAHSPNELVVGTVVLVSKDTADHIILYSITNGNTNNAFAINTLTGTITVNDSNQLNYLSTPSFLLTVNALDPANGTSGTAIMTVHITSGLVAHFDFTNGLATDVTSSGNNGTISGAVPTLNRFGITNHALSFDSDDDYVNVNQPSFLDNSQGTFAAWVKFTALDHIQYVASVGDEQSSENYISFLRLDADTHTLGIYQREPGLANWVQGTTVIQPNVYYFLTMTSDGAFWKIYINGQEETLTVKNGSNTGKWIAQLNGIDNFVIGSSRIQPPFTIPYFSGTIDEVLLFRRVLGQEEITQLYNAGVN